MKIGANVSIAGTGLLAAVEETLSYAANTFMIYTRPNRGGRNIRKIENFHREEALRLMQEHGLDIKDAVVHAPYTINLGGKEDARRIGMEILREEIERTSALGIPYLVFHPGAHTGLGVKQGIENVANSLNEILTGNEDIFICLETMAGDGSKVGNSFEEIAEIIARVKHNHVLGVCIDTCHNWSMGYDIVNDFDGVMTEFDKIIGLDRLKVAHINGSKYGCGERRDRHANIGARDDTIGKEALRRICHHELLREIPLILETPYGQYKEEIAYLRGDDGANLSEVSLK
ncbi:deoxyribonuclease IV [Bacillaceae bacterium]